MVVVMISHFEHCKVAGLPYSTPYPEDRFGYAFTLCCKAIIALLGTTFRKEFPQVFTRVVRGDGKVCASMNKDQLEKDMTLLIKYELRDNV